MVISTWSSPPVTTDYLDNHVAERTSDYLTKMPARLVGVIIRRSNNKRPQHSRGLDPAACGDMIAYAIIVPHGPFQTLGNETSVVTIPQGEGRAVVREIRLAASSCAVTEYASGDLVTTSHVVTTAGSYYPDDLGNLDRTEETDP